MGDWTRFSERLPTDLEMSHWESWPQAGIGVVLGKLSNLVAIDRDYDFTGSDALDALIPDSPLVKRGEKGWTRFYQYNGEASLSFNVNSTRVLDLLSTGRQTVMPPTMHPSGCCYVYISLETIDSIVSTAELPKLPDDFVAQIERVLQPYQTDEDKKHKAKPGRKGSTDTGKINTEMSVAAQYFHDLNQMALDQLQAWVPKLIKTASADANGYRCIATWRNCKNPNVGITPMGIRDWGGNYGMTPIDLVMYSSGLPFQKAAETLRACLVLTEPEPIRLVASEGKQTKQQTKAITPGQLPWARIPEPPAERPLMLPPVTSLDAAPALPVYVTNPPGILGDVARWITATAPKQQPELSLAAAIALCAVAMGRTYRSQFGNWTGLYIIMIAKSTEGKEHPQQCVEKILAASKLADRIGGSGYTSAGAVYSALLKSPVHLATIDEIGKLIKTSRAKGNANAEAAIDKLVEAFGRQDGVLRPPTYSTMTMRGMANPGERVVHNPSITLLGATTPGTFYQNLTTDLIQDGFLGRCIVIESKQPRQLTSFVPRTEPPAKIIEWCNAVHASEVIEGNLAAVNVSEMPAKPFELPFDDTCKPIIARFEQELNDLKEASEGEGLDVLFGRTLEKAMKLAMIACKAENVRNKSVKSHHLEWAIQYVRHADINLYRAVRNERTEGETDALLKRLEWFIENAQKFARESQYPGIYAQGGIPHTDLLRVMKVKAREMNEIVETALESGRITKSPGHFWGYPGFVYFLSSRVE